MTITGSSIGNRVEVYPRKEFLQLFGREFYAQGQHLTMLGPTQRGKTTLCLQMLKRVISPELPCVILAGKPPGRDGTMAKAPQLLNLRVTEEWPPPFAFTKKNGYMLRPVHTLKDLDRDEKNLREQFRRAMISNYASKTPVIQVVDEAYQVQNDLSLKREYEAPLMRGAPICAEWSLIQRGRYMSYLAYDAAEHMVIFFDSDQTNVKRYSEMGGVDPAQVEYLVSNLKCYHIQTGPKTFTTISEGLYIRRAGPFFAIVDVK
jgi:hypothetical protein